MSKKLYCIIFLLFLLCPFFAHSSAQATSLPTLVASLELPTRPTPPTPPSVSGVKKETPAEEKEVPKKTTLQLPDTKKTPETSATQEKKQSLPKQEQTKQTTPPSISQDKPSQNDFILDKAENGDEAKTEKAAQQRNKEKLAETAFSPMANKIIYGIAAICLLALTAYFYLTTPNVAKPQKTAPRQAAAATCPSPAKQATAAYKKNESLLAAMPKIKNPSLLEQLIKYDMETYGELRSNLDYEQPAYVERLIRKYGGNDQSKINRAINLFYRERENKK